MQRRPAVLHQGPPGGEPPRGRRPLDDALRSGPSRPDRAAPAGIVSRALDDDQAGVVLERVALRPDPRTAVDPEMRIPAGDFEPVARFQVAEGPLDQDVGAAVEAEVLKVDSRTQR
jgi:hypothetical protein